MLGAPADRWGAVEHLLAHVSDLQQVAIQVAIAAAGGKPKPFKPMPRPGEKPKRERPKLLRLVDEQTGEELPDTRAVGERANQAARDLLMSRVPCKRSPEVTGSPPEEG